MTVPAVSLGIMPALTMAQLPSFRRPNSSGQPIAPPPPISPSPAPSPSGSPSGPVPQPPSPSNTNTQLPETVPEAVFIPPPESLSGDRLPPVAKVGLNNNGEVAIKLVNKTMAMISYEVIGDTSQRLLSGRSEVTLRSLKTPVNIAFRRDDHGFLQVKVRTTTENNNSLLELTLTEATSLDMDKTSLSVEETGLVFIN